MYLIMNLQVLGFIIFLVSIKAQVRLINHIITTSTSITVTEKNLMQLITFNLITPWTFWPSWCKLIYFRAKEDIQEAIRETEQTVGQITMVVIVNDTNKDEPSHRDFLNYREEDLESFLKVNILSHFIVGTFTLNKYLIWYKSFDFINSLFLLFLQVAFLEHVSKLALKTPIFLQIFDFEILISRFDILTMESLSVISCILKTHQIKGFAVAQYKTSISETFLTCHMKSTILSGTFWF